MEPPRDTQQGSGSTASTRPWKAVFLLLALPRFLPRYRQALTVAIVVCGIAADHFFRVFESFKGAYVSDAIGGQGVCSQATGVSLNEGYRYVDWLLTVPLLFVELTRSLDRQPAGR